MTIDEYKEALSDELDTAFIKAIRSGDFPFDEFTKNFIIKHLSQTGAKEKADSIAEQIGWGREDAN